MVYGAEALKNLLCITGTTNLRKVISHKKRQVQEQAVDIMNDENVTKVHTIMISHRYVTIEQAENTI
jgi:hypothetical protein